MDDRTPPREDGFTLIEILVVIGIIGLLAAVFAPGIFGARERADVAGCKARIAMLQTMIDGYKQVHGDVPPDDYTTIGDDEAAWNFGTDNGKNTGIESLVMHLSMQAKGGGRLDEHEDWLANTDGDKAPGLIELLQSKERKEVLDPWGTPFAYFTARVGSGYGKPQKILGRDQDGNPTTDVDASPWRNPDGGFFLPRSFQLISAGPNRKFNDDDDVANFEIPRP